MKDPHPSAISGLSPRDLLAGGLPRSPSPAGDGTDLSGRQIGTYRLIEPIGEGGMGVVYLAEQFEPVQREVAFKVVKRGMDTEGLLARFELERQTLAALDHPGIARVFDAGATEGGRPYFVMELVEGAPVTDYAEREGLDPDARLNLILQACAAVEHAHRRGVIHRDLKPTNLLVDGEGMLKVIDFGLAKLTRPGSGGGHTLAGEVFGTPGYMPPEQEAGEEVDTRADVFALGKVLGDLVGTDRELKWVVAKATDADAAQRYGSVTELADDLRRFLEDQPLTARRPTAAYRLRKFLRRHRGACFAAAIGVLLAGFGIRKAIEARGLRVEAEFANREAQKASVTTIFVNELLAAMNEPEDVRREAMRTAVRYFEDNLAGQYQNQPEVAFLTQQMLGVAYKTLDVPGRAERSLLAARDLAGTLPLGHGEMPLLMGVEVALGQMYTEQGRLGEAIEAARRMAEDPRFEVSPERIHMHLGLGRALCEANRHHEAEAVCRRGVEMERQINGWSAGALQLSAWVAHAIHRQGRRDEAIVMLQHARDATVGRLGADHHEIRAVEEDIEKFRTQKIIEDP